MTRPKLILLIALGLQRQAELAGRRLQDGQALVDAEAALLRYSLGAAS